MKRKISIARWKSKKSAMISIKKSTSPLKNPLEFLFLILLSFFFFLRFIPKNSLNFCHVGGPSPPSPPPPKKVSQYTYNRNLKNVNFLVIIINWNWLRRIQGHTVFWHYIYNFFEDFPALKKTCQTEKIFFAHIVTDFFYQKYAVRVLKILIDIFKWPSTVKSTVQYKIIIQHQ